MRTRAKAVKIPARIAVLALIVVLLAGCGTPPTVSAEATPTQSPSPTASPTASPAPTPTPVPTARPVTLKPTQVIIPLGEFPIAGYKVVEDGSKGDADFVWSRKFGPFTPADYHWVSITVYIYRSATAAHDAFVATMTKCDYGRPESPPLTSVELTAPPSGELVHACVFHFSNGDVYDYETLTRNVIITAEDNPRLKSITDASAVTTIADIAKRQVEILERVSPR